MIIAWINVQKKIDKLDYLIKYVKTKMYNSIMSVVNTVYLLKNIINI